MAVPCPPDVHLELDIKRWQDLTDSRYHVKFTVGTAQNIDSNVFVFKQLLSRDAATGTFDSEFEAVASPQAMADFKAKSPNVGQVFWRDSVLELEFDALPDAVSTEALVRADVEQLLEDTRTMLSSFQSETVVEI